jgi:hypothetical protein
MIIDIYIRRIKNISFGFGGSGFFVSQSGDRPPWYLNPNITFPVMIAFAIGGFIIVFGSGGIREKGYPKYDIDIEVASSSSSGSSSGSGSGSSSGSGREYKN